MVSETAFEEDNIYDGKQVAVRKNIASFTFFRLHQVEEIQKKPKDKRCQMQRGIKEGHTSRKKKMQRSCDWLVAIRGKKMESLDFDSIFLHGEAQGAIHACLSRAARLGAKLTTAKLILVLFCSGGCTIDDEPSVFTCCRNLDLRKLIATGSLGVITLALWIGKSHI